MVNLSTLAPSSTILRKFLRGECGRVKIPGFKENVSLLLFSEESWKLERDDQEI